MIWTTTWWGQLVVQTPNTAEQIDTAYRMLYVFFESKDDVKELLTLMCYDTNVTGVTVDEQAINMRSKITKGHPRTYITNNRAKERLRLLRSKSNHRRRVKILCEVLLSFFGEIVNMRMKPCEPSYFTPDESLREEMNRRLKAIDDKLNDIYKFVQIAALPEDKKKHG